MLLPSLLRAALTASPLAVKYRRKKKQNPFKLVIYVCVRNANKLNPFNWFAGINCLHSSQNDCALTIKYLVQWTEVCPDARHTYTRRTSAFLQNAQTNHTGETSRIYVTSYRSRYKLVCRNIFIFTTIAPSHMTILLSLERRRKNTHTHTRASVAQTIPIENSFRSIKSYDSRHQYHSHSSTYT